MQKNRPGAYHLATRKTQACIPAISSLRFFYEKYPELHVIAAGSLLEIALAEIPSFGVGRLRSLVCNKRLDYFSPISATLYPPYFSR